MDGHLLLGLNGPDLDARESMCVRSGAMVEARGMMSPLSLGDLTKRGGNFCFLLPRAKGNAMAQKKERQ